MISIYCFVLLSACNDEQLTPSSNNELALNAENLIQLKSGIDNLTLNLFSNNLKSFTNGRTQNVTHRFSLLTKQMTEENSEEWETCAESGLVQNEDGSITFFLNYGSGCEEADGQIYQGIIAFNIIESDSAGKFQIGFEDFGAVNQEATPASTTLTGWYLGEWVTHPSDQFLYLEEFSESFVINRLGESSENISAQGSFLANEFGLVVISHKFNGSNDQGNVYKGLVVEPLRFNSTCDASFIYTKGTEVYEVNGSSASIDFGNGSCDNAVTLQIDGMIKTLEF